MRRLRTIWGYDFGEVASAIQKTIRRGDARLGGYWAIELFEAGYHEYVWRRLLTISAEDCWGILTQEGGPLCAAFKQINAVRNKKSDTRGRIFIAKVVIILAMAKKSPDADHLTNLVDDARAVGAETLTRELEEAQRSPERIAIPGYALDCHTTRGRKLGKTKWDFFQQEHDALMPREPGLFDDDLEWLRRTIDELGGREAGEGDVNKAASGITVLPEFADDIGIIPSSDVWNHVNKNHGRSLGVGHSADERICGPRHPFPSSSFQGDTIQKPSFRVGDDTGVEGLQSTQLRLSRVVADD